MLKKILLSLILSLTFITLYACDTTSTSTSTSTLTSDYLYDPITVESYVLEEERKSFDFFWEVANTDSDSAGYGMISDRYNTKTGGMGSASIASVGFGLAGIPIAIENSWITYQEGYDRVLGTLETIEGMQRTHGFFYHFVSMTSATRSGNSEVSIIDTALMISGAIVAGEYFGGEIKTKVDEIYQAIEWDWFYDPIRLMFYMGYQPESGFAGHWDMYSEQLLLYFLAAGSDDYPIGKVAYDRMKSNSQLKSYGTGSNFYVSWPGTIFTYQYSHAFLDFRDAVDDNGVDWFENSIKATTAAQEYGVWLSNNYLTYNATAWGNTASDGPDGYRAYGNLPAAGTIYIDGTLAPSGAIGSIVFTPDLVISTMSHYASIPQLQSKYGFLDAYNMGLTPNASLSVKRPNLTIPTTGWFATDVIGIDKGITMLMIENYRSSLIWDLFMLNVNIQEAFTVLEFEFTN